MAYPPPWGYYSYAYQNPYQQNPYCGGYTYNSAYNVNYGQQQQAYNQYHSQISKNTRFYDPMPGEGLSRFTQNGYNGCYYPIPGEGQSRINPNESYFDLEPRFYDPMPGEDYPVLPRFPVGFP